MELKDFEQAILDYWFSKYGKIYGWFPTPRVRCEIEELAKKLYEIYEKEQDDDV